ncbi:MAG: SRPBCC family protein [Caldilineaceae bacterium]|nr:SRPBCC family protein [Caldilineaceae bacterium]
MMTRMYTQIHIERSPSKVFDFVTTPANWPRWHPSSLGVEGATAHSLAVGEQVTESFHVAGRRGQVIWTVMERDAPHRWVIDGRIVGRNAGGVVSYTLQPDGEGTLFQREFTYPTPTLFFTIIDRLVVRRRVQKESEQATQQLKTLLEMGSSRAALNANRYYFLDEWSVPASVNEVWPYIVNGGDYPRWWGMVYDKVESLNAMAGDQVGAQAAVQAHGRLPYTIHFTSEVTAVTAPTMMSLKAYGDLTGTGTWRLTPTKAGTSVTFEWIVQADKPLLRLLSPLVKPVLAENHRWTMRQGEAALQKLLGAKMNFDQF